MSTERLDYLLPNHVYIKRAGMLTAQQRRQDMNGGKSTRRPVVDGEGMPAWLLPLKKNFAVYLLVYPVH